jgi:hypothetical protein
VWQLLAASVWKGDVEVATSSHRLVSDEVLPRLKEVHNKHATASGPNFVTCHSVTRGWANQRSQGWFQVNKLSQQAPEMIGDALAVLLSRNL